VLASGRSLAGVLPIARALALDGWVAASNGAVIARVDGAAEPDGYTVATDDAKWVNVRAVTDAAIGRLGIAIALENIGAGYFVTTRFPAGKLRGTQTWAPLTALEALDTPRIALYGPGAHDLIEPLRAAGLTATPTEHDWLDVTPGGVSKATALETVRERLGVDPERTVAVGDSINDIEALTWAARGVAMGNAPTQVREAADTITGSLDQHGAAMVLRSLPRVMTTAG
jgi:HAD superfamily hydrolase (TIGR01484 family)